ncbi:MAG: PD-(D/E)XK nuclease family protein [Phycisphaerales bacterium]
MTFKVSHSKMKLWRQCRQAYHFKYVERLRRRRKGRPLMFGDIMHQMLDWWKEDKDPFERLDEIAQERGALFRREVEEYGDIIEDARVIMAEYMEYWADDDCHFVRIKGKSAEHEFEVEIDRGIYLTGKIDAFARRNRLRWLTEHKTFGKQLPEEDKRWKNVQSATYIRVNQILGLPPVDGTLWDFIGSKPPTKPQLLKDGTLSKKRILTLPSRVRQTIKEHGLKERDYKTLIASAEQGRDQYFHRVQNPINENVVAHLFEGLVATAREMRDLHGKVRDMNIDFHCDRCDYNGLCSAMLRGLDVDYVKEREYEVSKGKDTGRSASKAR